MKFTKALSICFYMSILYPTVLSGGLLDPLLQFAQVPATENSFSILNNVIGTLGSVVSLFDPSSLLKPNTNSDTNLVHNNNTKQQTTLFKNTNINDQRTTNNEQNKPVTAVDPLSLLLGSWLFGGSRFDPAETLAMTNQVARTTAALLQTQADMIPELTKLVLAANPTVKSSTKLRRLSSSDTSYHKIDEIQKKFNVKRQFMDRDLDGDDMGVAVRIPNIQIIQGQPEMGSKVAFLEDLMKTLFCFDDGFTEFQEAIARRMRYEEIQTLLSTAILNALQGEAITNYFAKPIINPRISGVPQDLPENYRMYAEALTGYQIALEYYDQLSLQFSPSGSILEDLSIGNYDLCAQRATSKLPIELDDMTFLIQAYFATNVWSAMVTEIMIYTVLPANTYSPFSYIANEILEDINNIRGFQFRWDYETLPDGNWYEIMKKVSRLADIVESLRLFFFIPSTSKNVHLDGVKSSLYAIVDIYKAYSANETPFKPAALLFEIVKQIMKLVKENEYDVSEILTNKPITVPLADSCKLYAINEAMTSSPDNHPSKIELFIEKRLLHSDVKNRLIEFTSKYSTSSQPIPNTKVARPKNTEGRDLSLYSVHFIPQLAVIMEHLISLAEESRYLLNPLWQDPIHELLCS